MNSTPMRPGDRLIKDMEPHEIFQGLAKLQPQNWLFWAKSYVKWRKTPIAVGAERKKVIHQILNDRP